MAWCGIPGILMADSQWVATSQDGLGQNVACTAVHVSGVCLISIHPIAGSGKHWKSCKCLLRKAEGKTLM
jgi:hypothetical protein